MEPIEIFRAGTHTASDGRTLSFSAAMVAGCARAYDPGVQEAPLVVGHPKENAPAYGWVAGLEFRDGVLLARPNQVDPDFAEMVKAGRFKKVSSAFYMPDAPNNPAPGALYLRHVGFLGAVPPAVKGLKSASFAAGHDGIVTFGAVDSEDRERALQAREAALRRGEINAFLEGLMRDGRVLPCERAAVASFMEGLSNDGVVQFSDVEGDAVSLGHLDWFRQWLSSRPRLVEFGEAAPESRAHDRDEAAGQYQVPSGYSRPDPAALALHVRAVAYQKAHGCDYRTAVLAVSNGGGR